MKSSELTGITYNGLSIEEHLARRPEPETEKIVKKEIAEKKKAIYYGRKGWIDEDGRKVSKRVSYLSANKIREEYGVMKKPYQTLTECVIWVVLNKGPVTANEIQHELNKTYNLSATVMKIWQGLAGIMGRDLRGPGRKQAFHYYISPQHIGRSVETLYGLYRTGKYKREEKVEPYKAGKKLKLPPFGEDVNLNSLKPLVEEALSKQLGLEVKVTGEIRVIFGFLK